MPDCFVTIPNQFLSTLSLRRATFVKCRCWVLSSVISIHALLAESDDWPPVRDIIQWISIHALLAESDLRKYPVILGNVISIHALLAESDPPQGWPCPGRTDFYPRSPCGERPTIALEFDTTPQFLSTLSLRRATP